jgi:hypothetical protein
MKLVDLVSSTILVRHFYAFHSEVLLEKWVYDDFLGNGVTGDRPGELMCPTLLRIFVTNGQSVLIVIFVDLNSDECHDGLLRGAFDSGADRDILLDDLA